MLFSHETADIESSSCIVGTVYFLNLVDTYWKHVFYLIFPTYDFKLLKLTCHEKCFVLNLWFILVKIEGASVSKEFMFQYIEG